MNTLSKIKRKFTSYKERIFPTQIQKEVKRYYKDGGDYHLRYNYLLNNESVVFDVGGFSGEFSSNLFSRMPCRIYIFEPVREYADLIKDRFKYNKMIKTHEFGLSNKTEKKKLAFIGEGSSTHRIRKAKKEGGDILSIKLVDIIEFINKNSILEIDLLKLNIEGGEYEVLPRLIEKNKIMNIKYLQIQFHDIDKESKIKKDIIRKDLEKTHYCEYCYEFIWENWIRKDK